VPLAEQNSKLGKRSGARPLHFNDTPWSGLARGNTLATAADTLAPAEAFNMARSDLI
jgi:hypothetical protein